MTQKDKLIEKLNKNPQNVNYFDIEKLFNNENYIIKNWWKWSHKMIIHKETKKYVTIAIHNNDCKIKYKRKLKEFYNITNK